MHDKNFIRNFCIIAHIDHGKSTLADRCIEMAEVLSQRNFHDQMLDSMDIEQERGITIKSQTVSLPYEHERGLFELNLIDTPGHVDFSYEVSRAVSACEGAILLVDATQGVQAQTVSNMYLALEHDLEIIPVINKIDLPAADPERVIKELGEILGFIDSDVIRVSAKTGEGLDELLQAVVERMPPPSSESDALQILLVDSHYDSYRGVILHVRVYNGKIKIGDEIQFLATGGVYVVEETGKFCINLIAGNELCAGEFGYIIAGIKVISDVQVGDTITHTKAPCTDALQGFRPVKPMVFSSIFPSNADDYSDLRTAIEKLKLNDAALVFQTDLSLALGKGFRCGFLGLLHLEVVQERLEREFLLDVVLTAPSVRYKMKLKTGEDLEIDNPQSFPDPSQILSASEPCVRAHLITPAQYMGGIMTLCSERRGVAVDTKYIDTTRVELCYDIPLAEILYDFYDSLKSMSRGYASLDYELHEYLQVDIVRLDILLNGNRVDALSQLVWKGNAERRARIICVALKNEIPRHQFRIPIQGCIGGKVIARETIAPFRKDVTDKCYGGDITRKKKLLSKQKAGKKRMKMVGNVELPQTAFLSVLKSRGED